MKNQKITIQNKEVEVLLELEDQNMETLKDVYVIINLYI